MQQNQLQLFETPSVEPLLSLDGFRSQVESFEEFGKRTTVLEFPDTRFDIRVYVNEFWTSVAPQGSWTVV